MKTVKHWQDPVNAVIGAWLILSPWALGFQGEQVTMANTVIVGILLLAVALGATFVPRVWEEWTEGALGVWLIASPWLLGFASHNTAMLNAVVTGAVIALLVFWALSSEEGQSGFSARGNP